MFASGLQEQTMDWDAGVQEGRRLAMAEAIGFMTHCAHVHIYLYIYIYISLSLSLSLSLSIRVQHF